MPVYSTLTTVTAAANAPAQTGSDWQEIKNCVWTVINSVTGFGCKTGDGKSSEILIYNFMDFSSE